MTGTWPMLARVPAGDLIDRMRHEPKLRAAEVLHSDTVWRPCTVLAWAKHRGGWAVLIRWRDGHEDWRDYDPRHIRPGDGSTLRPPRGITDRRPALIRGDPYVVTAGADAAGYFTDVVNLSNGKLVWSGGDCYNNGAVLPVVVGQQVISYGCGKGSNAAMQAFSSGGKFVCAYNISTGAQEWQNTTLPATTALAAEADGVLYLDFGDALNASTGKVIKTIWTKFRGKSATSIAVGDGRIAVVTNPHILDLYGLKGS